MEITDVTVDGHHRLLNMFKTMVCLYKKIILTEELQELAKEMGEISKLPHKVQQVDVVEFKIPFNQNPYQSLLMRQTGTIMNQVSFLTVKHQ